jgi:glycosyltransferase involved in cell wall biosynthesis
MKIAQVAPLIESVPPRGYGGTERVVHYLTEELIQLGHDVTLFASGDSRTSAELEAGSPGSLRSMHVSDHLPQHFVMLERLFRRIDDFDIVHFHLDYLHYPLSRRYGEAHVTTLHGRLDLPELGPLYREYADMPVVSISESQRKPLPWLNWQATVLHGLPLDLHRPLEAQENYLVFLGRVSPEKGLDQAIAIAQAAGLELRIAAKVDRQDSIYFEDVITPLLNKPGVVFLGEIGDDEKGRLLGQAQAVLLPIDWEEPFGMVMMEAMACGTPVIAYDRGSVPEVLEHGVTGFIVADVAQAVKTLENIGSFDRARCRAVFEQRFSARRMAEEYMRCYERILSGRQAAQSAGPALRIGS